MRFLFVAFGIAAVLLGFSTMINGGFNHHGIYIYLKESRYFVGGIFIILGVLFFRIAFKKRSNGIFEEKYLKCPKCFETFLPENFQSKICPKCGAEAEDLKDFFENHPGAK